MSIVTAIPTGDASVLDLAERFRADLPVAVRPALEQALDAHAAALASEIQALGRAAAAVVAPLAQHASNAVPPAGAELVARIRAIDEARLAIAQQALAFVRSAARRNAAADADRVIDVALAAAETVGAELPLLMRVPQEEARFYPQRGDPRAVRWLKTTKRLLRFLRRRPMRTIPAAGLARFHATATLTERLIPALGAVRRLHATALRVAAHQLYMAVEGLDGLRRATLDGAPAHEAAGALRDALQDAGRDEAARLHRLADEARLAMAAALDDAVAAFDRDVVRIGTLELPPSSAADSRRRRLLRRAAGRRRRLARAWERYEAAVGATLEARATLARIGALGALAAGRAAAGVRDVLEQRLIEPINTLARGLATSRAACAEVLSAGPEADSSLSAVRDHVEHLFIERRSLLDEAAPAWADLDSRLDMLLAELAGLPAGAAEAVRVLASVPMPASWKPARARRYLLSAQELARVHVDGRLGRAASDRIRAIRPDLEGICADLRNARKAVVFHFAAATSLPTPGADDADSLDRITPPDHIVGVLDRAERQIEELGQTGAALRDALADDLLREGGAAARQLFASAVGGPGAVRVDLYAERIVIWRTRARRAIRGAASAGAAAARQLRRAALSLGRARQQVRERIGLEAMRKEAALASADQSILDERTVAGLPDGYRQIFTLEPIDSDEFLVGRDADLETFAAAVRRFDAGQPAAVAVYGEKGSGKTSLIRAAVRRVLPGRALRTLELHRITSRTDELLGILRGMFGRPDAASLAELARLVRGEPPQIAIIEEAHRLFHRRVGGFDALRAFLAFLAETRPNVLWILTMDQYAWAYLDHVLGIGRSFEFEVCTTNLPPDTIEQAILARHEVSGYALRFEPGEHLRRSRRFQRLSSERARQAEARRAFFADLTRIAEGNIFVALFYWLRSIAAVESHALVLRGPRTIEASFLEDLPLDTLHTAAAVIQHGGLGVEDHAACFQATPARSRLALAAMADARLLFRADDGTYRINKVLYRPFVRLLRDRNLF